MTANTTVTSMRNGSFDLKSSGPILGRGTVSEPPGKIENFDAEAASAGRSR